MGEQLGAARPATAVASTPASLPAGAIDSYLSALSLGLRQRCGRCRATAGAGWLAAVTLCLGCRESVEEVGADLDAAAYERSLAGMARANAEVAAVADLMPADALAQLLLKPVEDPVALPAFRPSGVAWLATALLPVFVSILLVGWAALVPLFLVVAASAGSQASGVAGAVAGVAAVSALTWVLTRASDALAGQLTV